MQTLPSLSIGSSYNSPRRQAKYSNKSSGNYYKSTSPRTNKYTSHGSSKQHSQHHHKHSLLGPGNNHNNNNNRNKQFIWSGSQYNGNRNKHRDKNPYMKSSPRHHGLNKLSNPYEPSPPRQKQRHYNNNNSSSNNSHHHFNQNQNNYNSGGSHRHHRHAKPSPRRVPVNSSNGVPTLGLEGIWASRTSHLQSDEVSNNGQGGPLSSRVHRKPRGIGHLSSIRQPNSARVGGSSYEQGSTNYRYKENGNHHKQKKRHHNNNNHQHNKFSKYEYSKQKNHQKYIGIGTNHALSKQLQPTATHTNNTVGGLLSMQQKDMKIPIPPSQNEKNNPSNNTMETELLAVDSKNVQKSLKQQQQQITTASSYIPPPPLPIESKQPTTTAAAYLEREKKSTNQIQEQQQQPEPPPKIKKDGERNKEDVVVMTPAEAFKKHMNELSDHEHGEILEYSKIYYVGNSQKKVKKHKGNNRGYDDDRGDYKIVMNDHIGYRFEIMGPLGKGSFGQVVKVYDYKYGTMCAVKIIRNKKRFHQQAKVEVNILKHLKKKDKDRNSNIIHIKEHFYFRGHLCITFDLMSVNLYEFIKNNNFQGVSLGLIRRFAIQLLTSLNFLAKQNIIHCDLKPENILLKKSNRSGIRVIDLGSSCFVDERVYTYIQSRFYRSPEVILGLAYGTAIDMWSFACILAELYTGYPLFPGENEQQQLLCIMEIMGCPNLEMLNTASRKKLFFDSRNKPRIIADSRGRKRQPGSKNLSSVLKCKDKQFVDFLQKCLTWDPAERYSAAQAMEHPWVLNGPAPTITKSSGSSGLPKIQGSRRRRY